MDKTDRLNKLGVLFREFSFSLETLKDRIILQKTIYLLKYMGLNLGYNFSYHLYGPYCGELTLDAYKRVKTTVLKLTKNEEEAIIKLKKILKLYPNDSTWYELLATTLFFKKEEKLDEEKIFNEILKKKPYLSNKERYNIAYNHLNNLIPMFN